MKVKLKTINEHKYNVFEFKVFIDDKQIELIFNETCLSKLKGWDKQNKTLWATSFKQAITNYYDWLEAHKNLIPYGLGDRRENEIL